MQANITLKKIFTLKYHYRNPLYYIIAPILEKWLKYPTSEVTSSAFNMVLINIYNYYK